MRTEQEMMKLIFDIAENDDIRAVVMFGSRANPNAPKDIYQDYDIYYIVRDISPYINNPDWVKHFGETSLLYMPSDMIIPEPLDDGTRAYLMLFPDGNRIDLCLCTKEVIREKIEVSEKGQPLVVLLDKDELLPDVQYPNDDVYHVKPPTSKHFYDACMGFFWELQNVAKGIKRDELSYSMFLLNLAVRDMLNCMVEWKIGIETDFSVSTGKLGKYYKQYMDKRQYDMYAKTFPSSDYEHMWNAMFMMCDLFKELAIDVANHFSFKYPQIENDNIVKYLNSIKDDNFR